MKITHHQNPLNSTIEISDMEKEVLRLKIKVELLNEGLWTGTHYLRANKPDLALAELETYERWTADGPESFVTQRLNSAIESLIGPHVGDCTCVACTCDKCVAEEHLGVNTIKGLGKHAAYHVHSTFTVVETLDEAIDRLSQFETLLKYPGAEDLERWGGLEKFKSYIPAWAQQAKTAEQWLIAYRLEHFSDHQESTRVIEVPLMLGT